MNIKITDEIMRFELRGATLHAISPPVEPLPMAAEDAQGQTTVRKSL